jgi:hypothetical protein
MVVCRIVEQVSVSEMYADFLCSVSTQRIWH